MKRILAAALSGVLALAPFGCARMRASLPSFGYGDASPATNPAGPLVWTPYPKDAEFGEDYDIVATQTREGLKLNNRCPRSFQSVQIWLNQQYVAEVARIDIGSGNRIPLRRFVNEHGEHFPVAGLLTPDRGFPVISCVMFDPASGRRHRLLARQ